MQISDTFGPDQKIKEIIVQAQKIQDKQLASPTPVQLLGQKQLRRINSFSVAEAIRYFSGVQLKDYGGIGGLKTINVRSMGTQHTTVFYDGIPMKNAQNGQVDLGKFSLTNLDEVRLYNAEKSGIFQPAIAFASGASLYLQSRKAVFKNAEKTHLGGAFQSGSFGLINPSAYWQQKWSKNIKSTLSTEFTRANGRYPFRYTNGVYDTTAVRHNADITAWRMEGKLSGRLPDSSSWRLQGYSYQSERGLPGAAVANHFDHYQRLWNKDRFVQGAWHKNFSDKYALKMHLKYAWHKTRYLDPFFQNIEGKLDNHYKEKKIYTSIANRFRFIPWWETVFSVDYSRDKLDANLYRFSYPTRHTTMAVVASRLHFARFDFQSSLLGTFVRDRVKRNAGAADQSEFTPSLSASWQPFEHLGLRLRVFYKNIFRMPTFNDLYYTLVGNTRLKPEYVKQFNVGVTFQKVFHGGFLKSTALTVDGYHYRVKDKIIATPGANLFRWKMTNLQKVDIKGLDVHADNQWLIAQNLFLNTGISYTFQQALNVTPDWYNYKNQIPYTPRNSGSLTASLDWNSWSLNYSFLYTGARYSQAANIPANYLPPRYTHDISLGKKWDFKKRYLKLMAEVNNLANQQYELVRNFPMPGRSYRFSLSVQF